MTNAGQNKLKVQLKLSISRLRMVQQKDSAKVKLQRREMAQLIEVLPPSSPSHHHCDAFHQRKAATNRHLQPHLRYTC